MDSVKNEVKNENVNIEKTVRPSRILEGKKTYRRLSGEMLSQNKTIK